MSGLAARAARSLVEDAHDALVHLVVNRLVGSALVPRALRAVLYRAVGIRVGVANVFPHVTLVTTRLTLGRDAMVNSGCLFDNRARVVLGDRVRVGPRVSFVTSTHEVGGPDDRAGCRYDAGIRVGAGSWIGAGATVLPGVTIGPGCVVAAGAVVTRDCAPDGLYAGVPARRVRDLPTEAADRDRDYQLARAARPSA